MLCYGKSSPNRSGLFPFPIPCRSGMGFIFLFVIQAFRPTVWGLFSILMRLYHVNHHPQDRDSDKQGAECNVHEIVPICHILTFLGLPGRFLMIVFRPTVLSESPRFQPLIQASLTDSVICGQLSISVMGVIPPRPHRYPWFSVWYSALYG